ncbi:MAG: DUF2225 domain-containing protein [Syntrophomonadaceae bacterium]|nr:DUF2225 domain-containing protein [Syntrophomonadaceae bacterium]
MPNSNKLFARNYSCPICKTSFTSMAVRRSASYVLEKESDLHIIYRGLSPLHYSIIVCPGCSYAASNSTFNDDLPDKISIQLAGALLKLKSEKLPDFNEERNIDTALISMQMAIRTAQLKKVPPAELAGLLLGAAWLSRETGNQDLEFKYMREALAKYIEAYQNGSDSIGNLTDVQAVYLIGELNLRLGNYNEAVNWFNQVIFHKSIKNYPQIEKQAREQWALARESFHGDTPKNPVIPEVSTNNIKVGKEETAEVIDSNPKTKKRRPLMQMPIHLYSDQIEWITGLVNSGYTASRCLVTREEIVRAILDAIIETLQGNLPVQFASEEDLKQQFIEIFTHQE